MAKKIKLISFVGVLVMGASILAYNHFTEDVFGAPVTQNGQDVNMFIWESDEWTGWDGNVSLPAGSATEAKQDDMIIELKTIATNTLNIATTSFTIKDNQTNKTQMTQITDGTDEVLVSGEGNMNITNFMVEVARGNISGMSAINKFGENPEITTGTDPEDVWAGGGLYAFYPTTATSVSIVSTSVEDDAGGTGCASTTVFGLDANWEEQSEVVNLDGTTPVALANTYIRLYRSFCNVAGSSNSNVGDITVYSDTAVGIFIDATDGQTQQALYTIPAGKSGYFVKGYVAISKGGSAAAAAAEFKWKARLNNGVNGAWATKGQIECVTSGSSWWQYEYGIPVGVLPEKTDIRIEATEVTATLGVAGGFDILLIDN